MIEPTDSGFLWYQKTDLPWIFWAVQICFPLLKLIDHYIGFDFVKK